MTEDKYVSELESVVGLDIESSGLDEQGDQILEVAAVFGKFVEGSFVENRRIERVLPLTTDIASWHEKVVEMHSSNGLIAAAIKAKKQAENDFRSYDDPCQLAVDRFDQALIQTAPNLPFKSKWTLLGNSVHFDLRFMRRVFPKFARLLSHRVIDVSAIRLFCESLGRPYVKGEIAHRAMADVQASLTEFHACQQWLRDHFTHAGAVAQATDIGWNPPVDDGELGRTACGHGAG